MSLMENIQRESIYLQVWVYWLMALNSLSIAFVRKHKVARATLAAWVVNMVIMELLYNSFGYVKLLGLSHIIVWCPLLIYLFKRLGDLKGAVRYWTLALFSSNLISLLIDFRDVIIYFIK